MCIRDRAHAELRDESLSTSQLEELDAWYEEIVVSPVNDAGLGPVTLDDARPQTPAAQYLQYHYTIGFTDRVVRAAAVDAGDGSAYSEVHSEVHPALSEIAEIGGYGDLLLVSSSGDIVYSTDKRIDFGTNLQFGPYSDTVLADTVLSDLRNERIGESVFSDIEIYLPGDASPAFFVAAGVRRDTEVIGALVVEIPGEALDAITTAGGEWEEVGLASGESYVVGADKVLRSESRLWLEDPDAYLDKVDDPELAALIQVLGSPVGLQPVDTEPVRVALEGDPFQGTAKNYLGRSTFSYASEIDAEGVDWVVVADIPLGDAREPLMDYAKRIGLVLAILLPVAAVMGLWMARRLTRPIPPVVDAAVAVAGGERDPDLPEMGNDEFGDLARRLRLMAGELGRQEQELADEYETQKNLLLTVLPNRMVEDDGAVSGTGDVVETATVIAVSLERAVGDVRRGEDELVEVLHEVLELAETLAERHGVERVRASVDRYLFLAGIGNAADGAGDALAFVGELAPAIGEQARSRDVELSVHIGVSSGLVATGMLERGSLTFAAWGEPVRRALAIGALARSDEVLVDASTAESAGHSGLMPATDVLSLIHI